MFSIKVIVITLALIVTLAVAASDHDSDHTHDHDHTHAPTLQGKCPDFPPIASLDISKLNGDWFVTHCLKKGFDDDHDHIIKCVKETFASRSDGSFDAEMSMNRDGHELMEKWLATPLAGKTGQFSAAKNPKEKDGKEMTITILDTDNTGFLISAGCISHGDKHGYKVKVFSRTKTLPATDMDTATALLKKLNINGDLTSIEQSC